MAGGCPSVYPGYGFNRTFLVLKSFSEFRSDERTEKRFNRTFLVLKLSFTAGSFTIERVLIAPFWY